MDGWFATRHWVVKLILSHTQKISQIVRYFINYMRINREFAERISESLFRFNNDIVKLKVFAKS